MNNTTIQYKKNTIYTVGRPIKYTYEKKLEILQKLVEYVEKEEYPTMPEFCVQNRIAKQRIYEFAKDENLNSDCEDKPSLAEFFSDCICRMNDKQEYFMETSAINDSLPPYFVQLKLLNIGKIGWSKNQKEEETDSNQISDALKLLSAVKEAVDKKELDN